MHGDMRQEDRNQIIQDFRNGKSRVLITTDLLARGIDIQQVSIVINYDIPHNIESYIHRIGRTARAGSEGTAYSFCSSEERNFLRDIERLTKSNATEVEHKFHSEAAKDAVGNAAKPKPRGQRSSRFESRRPRGFGGSNNQESRGRSFGGNRERSSFNKRPSFRNRSRDPRSRDSSSEQGRFIRSNGSLGRDRRSGEDRRSGGSNYGNRNSGGRDSGRNNNRRSGGSNYGNRNSGRSGGSSYGGRGRDSGRGRDDRGSGRNAGSSRPRDGGHRRTSERGRSEGGRGNSRFDRRSSGSSKPRFNNSKNRR